MLADTPFVHILHPTRFDAVKLVAVDGFDDGPVLEYPFVIADMRFLFVPVGVNDPVRDEPHRRPVVREKLVADFDFVHALCASVRHRDPCVAGETVNPVDNKRAGGMDVVIRSSRGYRAIQNDGIRMVLVIGACSGRRQLKAAAGDQHRDALVCGYLYKIAAAAV